MKRKPNFIYLQLLFLLVAIFLTAYTAYTTVAASTHEDIKVFSATAFAEPEVKEPDIKPKEFNLAENAKLAKEINDYIKTLDNIGDSVCFVMYDQCFVAIKCEDLVTKEAVKKAKQNVEKSVLGKFDKIKSAHVTNDMQAFIKMQNIEKRLAAGENITDMKKELLELRKFFHRPKHFKRLKTKR